MWLLRAALFYTPDSLFRLPERERVHRLDRASSDQCDYPLRRYE